MWFARGCVTPWRPASAADPMHLVKSCSGSPRCVGTRPVLFSIYHVANGKQRDEAHDAEIDRLLHFTKASMKLHGMLPVVIPVVTSDIAPMETPAAEWPSVPGSAGQHPDVTTGLSPSDRVVCPYGRIGLRGSNAGLANELRPDADMDVPPVGKTETAHAGYLAAQAARLKGALSIWAKEGDQRAAMKRRGLERERDRGDTDSSDMQELGKEAARVDEIYEDERRRLIDWNQSRLNESHSRACGSNEVPGGDIEQCICTRGQARCTNWRPSRDAVFGWTCDDCALDATSAFGCRRCGCRGCARLGRDSAEEVDLQAAAYLQALEWDAEDERGDPPSDYEFPPDESEDPDLTDWGASYRRHRAREDKERENMIEDNQTELIARAEEVLRGLEKEEEEILMLEAVEAAARTELQEEARAWEAADCEEEEKEERELAEVVALMNKMRENELASVAMSSFFAPVGAGAPTPPKGDVKHPCP
jgi:hypothetical protein